MNGPADGGRSERMEAHDEDQVETSADTWSIDEAVSGERFPEIPDYRILRLIGQGGMGRVYEAIHEPLGRTVALKVLRGGHRTPEMIDRFMKEMRVLVHVEHPGVARVFDAGSYSVDGDVLPFFVMEYVAGARQLNDFLHPVELPLPAKLDLFARVCDAVAHLHDRGVVHRDLKPDNILIGQDGEPKLIDFGVAKVLGPVLPGTDSVETQPGLAPGTPMYMSPEQTEGESSLVTGASDIYSLGVTFYKLLTGSLPYKIDDRAGLPAYQVIRSVPIVPATERDPTLPRSIDLVLGRALERHPDDRYTSAEEFAADLRRVAEGETPEWAQKGEFTRLVARTRRKMRRRPLAACGIASLIGVALTLLVAQPLMVWWQVPARAAWGMLAPLVGSAAAQAASDGSGVASLDGVRVIAMSDRTLSEAERLAEELDASGFDPRSATELRWLHAAVLERLAETSVRAVVFDYYMSPTETEWDGRMIAAAQRLCDAGIPVVIGVTRWDAPGGIPDVHEGLARACDQIHVGGMTIGVASDTLWSVDLAIRRQNDLARPGLALAGYAVSRQQGASFDIELRGDTGEVVIRHWVGSVVRGGIGEEISIGVSTTKLDGDSFEYGLSRGDVVAKSFISIPPEDVLEASTIDYLEVLELDSAELDQRVKGLVVMLGATARRLPEGYGRALLDVAPYPDGREMPKVYAHATALHQLSNAVRIRPPTDRDFRLLVLGGSVIGAVSALAAIRSRRSGLLGLLACVCVVCLLIAVLARFAAVIVDPTLLLIAAGASWGVGMLLLRRAPQPGLT